MWAATVAAASGDAAIGTDAVILMGSETFYSFYCLPEFRCSPNSAAQSGYCGIGVK